MTNLVFYLECGVVMVEIVATFDSGDVGVAGSNCSDSRNNSNNKYNITCGNNINNENNYNGDVYF